MTDEPPASAQILATLRSTFGFAALRPLQEQVIRSILRRQDVFVLMPTGGGKSLCYQLPALLQNGVTVVVSPLIALMKDQVDKLQSLGITATFINSSLDPSEGYRRQVAVVQGKVKLLYVAPERLMMPGFLDLLSRVRIALFAVDEAHCISEWGHDFRPEYRELRRLREMFPSVPVAAFTATATRRVQADILAQLQLRNAASFRGSLDRPNLYYQVWPKEGRYEGRLLDYLSRHRDCSGIIYVLARASTESLAAKLQSHGYRAVAYHAGLEAEERRRGQEAFLRNEARIVVATIAFGMGIDKPDIRFVIHCDMPKNLEGYYQESGRAGRDGQPSDAILFYTYGDTVKQEYFIKQKPSPSERKIAMAQLAAMVKWAEGVTCRREALLAYFDDRPSQKPTPCCDICHPVVVEEKDCTVPARMLLSCAKRTGETFGMVYLVRVLVGSRDQRILDNGHQRLPAYGMGKDWTRQEWRYMAQGLLRKGYIRLNPERFNAVEMTKLGQEVLLGGRKVSLALPPFATPALKGGAMASAPPARNGSFPATSLNKRTSPSDSVRVTLELFQRGMTPAEIAAERSLAPSTVEGHLAQAMEAGKPVDLRRLVSDQKRTAIEAALRRLGPAPLAPVKEALGDGYTYSEIRFVRASLGLERLPPG